MNLPMTGTLLAILLIPLGAFAQSDVTVKWRVDGIPNTTINSIEYDLNIGSNYYAINGAYTFKNGFSVPSTGTCFDTSGDGVLCNVTINAANASLDIGVDLTGTIKIFDANGNTSESGTLTLISVK